MGKLEAIKSWGERIIANPVATIITVVVGIILLAIIGANVTKLFSNLWILAAALILVALFKPTGEVVWIFALIPSLILFLQDVSAQVAVIEAAWWTQVPVIGSIIGGISAGWTILTSLMILLPSYFIVTFIEMWILAFLYFYIKERT